ncbi:hypothetical protein KUV80_10305 [Fictibacillus nanhaiensis]|uniref:hypothetical protein n=1 Tax=Fictibacillus nanhaiensis TaxID=742169 RepID=UPI001C95E01D|nr:hypothetical protein [Fictibacillus nanhaiensis]MBY6037050.1 hypothetical protein [Fictibacillus nanhaiensis]
MTQIIILLVFTLLVSPLLYFFPSSIPMKFKLILLGVVFLIATGGLFLLNVLSYWTSIATMIGVAFIISYFAEKRYVAKKAQAQERAEILLSFKKEPRIRPESRLRMEQPSEVEAESAATAEKILNQSKEKVEIEQYEEIHLEELEINEEKVQEDELLVETTTSLEPFEPLALSQKPMDLSEVEISEDEFAFLTKDRESLLEDLPHTDILENHQNDERLTDRHDWFDDLEDVSKHSEQMEENIEKGLEVTAVHPDSNQEECIVQTLLEQEVRVSDLIGKDDYPDMDTDVQYMFLNTLELYYQERDYPSYQAMLESILSQPLSDRDYYLFAKLLVDFYISTNYVFKATELLLEMKNRLKGYSVISEEIHDYLTSF